MKTTDDISAIEDARECFCGATYWLNEDGTAPGACVGCLEDGEYMDDLQYADDC